MWRPDRVLKASRKSSFYAAMLMVGLAIWACQQVHAGAWGLSAVTLIAMVLTAVVDFRKLGEHRSVGQMY